ncbi:type IV pilus modification PilV family protein [Persephonella sp.]
MVQIVLSNKNGYTLVEALVSLFIFALVLIFMLQGFTVAYKINFQKLVKDETVRIAQDELESIRNMDPDKIYDINNDGKFEDIANRTDCPVCSTSPAVPECVITRQVRNVNVKFGKQVLVDQPDPAADIFRINVTICTDYTDFHTGNKVTHTISTVIAREE